MHKNRQPKPKAVGCLENLRKYMLKKMDNYCLLVFINTIITVTYQSKLVNKGKSKLCPLNPIQLPSPPAIGGILYRI